MARTINCPGCQNTLHIRPSFAEPTLTCPRCLAEVANPGPEARPAQAQTAITAEQRPSGAEDRCPNCGEAVKRGWRMCPACDEWLGKPLVTRRQLPFAERQARQDTTVVGAVFLILTVLGIAGFVLVGAEMGLGDTKSGQGSGDLLWVATIIGTGILLLLALVGSIALTLRPEGPNHKGAKRVIIRRLGAAGTIILAILSLLLAGVVFFLGTCATIISRGF